MDDATAALLRAAGLEATADRFPEDIRDALATLAKHKANLPRSSDPRLEPTPPYAPRRGHPK